MKFNKLVSKSVIAIALLGTTLGGAFSGINANAVQTQDPQPTQTSQQQSDPDNNPQSNNTDGNINYPNTSSGMVNSSNPKSSSSNNHDPQTNTHIKDGFLTLDSVPHLNFGESGNYNTQSSQPTQLNLDSNNEGTLRVTDYRNLDKSNSNDPVNQSSQGWKVTATMSNFSNKNGYNNTDENDWTINLNNNNNYNNLDNYGNGTRANFNQQTLNPNQTSQPILNSEQGSSGRGYGVNEVNYNKQNDATLNIPNVPSGDYTATINWNLSTPLNSYNTNTNS